MSDIEINEKDRMHQLLCAYVLGEADAAERAEVEQALAGDAALREEKDRIASTIGLVQGAFGSEEVLSWRATSEVTRAAAQIAAGPAPAPRPYAWYRSPAWGLAASFVGLVGVSYLGWQAFVVKDGARRSASTLTAAADYIQQLKPYDASSPPPPAGPAGKAGDYRDEAGRGAVAGEQKNEVHLRALGYSDSAGAGKPQSGFDTEVKAGLEVAREADLRKQSDEALALRASGLKDDRAVDGAGAPVDSLTAGIPEQQPPAAAPSVGYIARPGAVAPGGSVVEVNRFGQPAVDPASNPPPPQEGRADELYFLRGNGGANAPVPAPKEPALAASTPTGGAGGGPGSAGPAAASAAPATPGPAEAKGKAAAVTDAKKREELGPRINKLRLLSDMEDGQLDYRESKSIEALLDAQLAQEVGEQAGGETQFERLDRFKLDKDAGDDASRRQRYLTPEEERAHVERIIVSCRRLPNESPRDMFFRFWGDNPYEWTANDRQSTFSMDVDTASYTLARKYLVENHLPEKAQIRTEEFVNYFKPDVAPPKGKDTFAIATELAPSRYSDPRENKWMLRVAVRGQEVQRNERAPMTLTFVVDVSGSMKENQRLELVKHALRQLVGQLDARDSIAIVVFSQDARLVLPMTSASNRSLIESAINPLQPEQSTNTEAGLRMGYEQALAGLTKNATNRVVLLTDGVANVGIQDPNVLVQSVERQRKAGIYLNTIGVGMNNHNDNLLEQLADKGDGLCNYVDDAAEVKRALVDNFVQALVPIARDAKVQVEFDPAQVESYRLLGYENRAIADQDFRNDKVDAGEINSGHQVTALYEIVRTPAAANAETPLARVRVRFKPPHKDGLAQPASEEASEIMAPVQASSAAGRFDATPFGYRRAVIAAQFAEFLRRSVHARGDSLEQLIADARQLAGDSRDAETAELSDMIAKSKALLDGALQPRGPFEVKVHELRERCFERERLQSLKRDLDRERLRILDMEVASIENELRSMFDHPRVR